MEKTGETEREAHFVLGFFGGFFMFKSLNSLTCLSFHLHQYPVLNSFIILQQNIPDTVFAEYLFGFHLW